MTENKKQEIKRVKEKIISRAGTFRIYHIEKLPEKKRKEILQAKTIDLLEEIAGLSDRNKHRKVLITECVLREYTNLIIQMYENAG